jgi:uncharacterized protein YdeI (YjbR/CyaY-like superfamily)
MKPRFFRTGAGFRSWLERNHAAKPELLVGFWKRDSGKPSLTWPESVDQALCFGWIDGVRRRIDDLSYSIRFTPRRPGSIWSNVNRKRMAWLIGQGLVHPSGLAAFERRVKQGVYAYEQHRRRAALPPAMQREFRRHAKAWRWYRAQPPWYRRVSAWCVISAKREETRSRRLARLIADSAAGRKIGPAVPGRTAGG